MSATFPSNLLLQNVAFVWGKDALEWAQIKGIETIVDPVSKVYHEIESENKFIAPRFNQLIHTCKTLGCESVSTDTKRPYWLSAINRKSSPPNQISFQR